MKQKRLNREGPVPAFFVTAVGGGGDAMASECEVSEVRSNHKLS